MIFFGAKTNKPTIYTDLELDIIDNIIHSEEEIERVIHTAISGVLTKEEIERFYNDSLVKEFLQHSKILMDIISQYLRDNHFKDKVLTVNNQVLDFNEDTEYYYKIDNKKRIISSNDYSKIIDNKILIKNIQYDVKETIKRYSKSKALAFFYQSWESNTLLEIEEVYLQHCTKEADKRYLLIHDGIYTKVKINKEFLENLRSSKNTFNVSYKIEQ
ncbi:hypothetical protein [Sulfurimonas sp.]|uniref:hypothetical protein n=1 Tax=Sulfurimonas sp. TaxID=2022749 RepID=UPI002B45E72C|nr:hypothetical protein [Sulfurimonas sp.]